VQIRYRGAWARTWPKRPLKIFFASGHEFQGNHCLNLNSAWRDPAMIREPLAYRVYALCGVPASQTRFVRLEVNGQFYGLYVEVEQPDKPLLKRHGLKGASIYKANSHDDAADERDLGTEQAYARQYEKQNHKTNGFGDLREFCRDLARTTNTVEFFNQNVDVTEYINYLAVTALIQNWDCFSKNHFLVRDNQRSKKWLVLPWDLDRTFGDHWNGGFSRASLPVLQGVRKLPGPTGWNRLADRFLNEPTLRARFLSRLEELLRKEFTPATLFPIIDQLEADIATDAALDRKRWPAENADVHRGIAGVKAYIEHRRTFLLQAIADLKP
jgi:spore coat protein H